MLKKSVTSQKKLNPLPAVKFVKAANQFESEINLERGGHKVNGKSMMGLMELSNRSEEQLTLLVDGEDASQAIEVLGNLLEHELNKN